MTLRARSTEGDEGEEGRAVDDMRLDEPTVIPPAPGEEGEAEQAIAKAREGNVKAWRDWRARPRGAPSARSPRRTRAPWPPAGRRVRSAAASCS